MDPIRFEGLVRILGRRHPRRAVLAALVGGPVSLRRGRATTARHKKNPCAHQPNDAPCQGTGRCLSGVCIPDPSCLPTGADCATQPTGCCSRTPGCEQLTANTPPICFIATANPGDSCRSNQDCAGDFHCVGYVCQSTSCPPASDFCTDGASPCGLGGAGLCLRPRGGGDARCGVPSPTTSCGCSRHRHCSDRFGTGAFCARFTPGETGGCNCEGKHTFCAVPA